MPTHCSIVNDIVHARMGTASSKILTNKLIIENNFRNEVIASPREILLFQIVSHSLGCRATENHDWKPGKGTTLHIIF